MFSPCRHCGGQAARAPLYSVFRPQAPGRAERDMADIVERDAVAPLGRVAPQAEAHAGPVRRLEAGDGGERAAVDRLVGRLVLLRFELVERRMRRDWRDFASGESAPARPRARAMRARRSRRGPPASRTRPRRRRSRGRSGSRSSPPRRPRRRTARRGSRVDSLRGGRRDRPWRGGPASRRAPAPFRRCAVRRSPCRNRPAARSCTASPGQAGRFIRFIAELLARALGERA